jgi:DNA polymerase III subunit gamma/tau
MPFGNRTPARAGRVNSARSGTKQRQLAPPCVDGSVAILKPPSKLPIPPKNETFYLLNKGWIFMSYQVLARKWRPKNFDEVIGQEHVTRSLKNAIVRGSVAHAYVLTGTRGIGKTTIARLLAKALRCLNLTDNGDPCHECESCLDFDSGSSMNVMEIDGASNNSVDNVRDLIGSIHYLPTIGSKKIYIIDEVHMLSTNAFNALLKTLEEPPEHVVFILATTEPQKLLGTVLSRCVRFDLRHVSHQDLVKHVVRIAADENFQFANEQLIHLLCKQGKGSVRDTLSLLEQVLSYSHGGKITEEELTLSLGTARLTTIKNSIAALLSGDVSSLRKCYLSAIYENVAPKNFILSLMESLYEIINHIDEPAKLEALGIVVAGDLEEISSAELFWIYETLAKDTEWALESLDPEKSVELVLQKLTLRREFFNASSDVKLSVKKKIVEPIISKTWDGFLSYLESVSPTILSNIEQGNLTKSNISTEGNIIAEVEFPVGADVFFDHLNDEDIKNRVEGYLAEYFETEITRVSFAVSLAESEEQEFISIDEQNRQAEEKILEEKRLKFLSQPILIEAQKVFNADVDKVVVTKK